MDSRQFRLVSGSATQVLLRKEVASNILFVDSLYAVMENNTSEELKAPVLGGNLGEI